MTCLNPVTCINFADLDRYLAALLVEPDGVGAVTVEGDEDIQVAVGVQISESDLVRVSGLEGLGGPLEPHRLDFFSHCF